MDQRFDQNILIKNYKLYFTTGSIVFSIYDDKYLYYIIDNTKLNVECLRIIHGKDNNYIMSNVRYKIHRSFIRPALPVPVLNLTDIKTLNTYIIDNGKEVLKKYKSMRYLHEIDYKYGKITKEEYEKFPSIFGYTKSLMVNKS